MRSYTIEISEPIYKLLNQQATSQSSSLEKVLEPLLSIAPFVWSDTNQTTTEDALAAVHRLTTLFDDVQIPNLEEIVHDPMIELINVDLDYGLI